MLEKRNKDVKFESMFMEQRYTYKEAYLVRKSGRKNSPALETKKLSQKLVRKPFDLCDKFSPRKQI